MKPIKIMTILLLSAGFSFSQNPDLPEDFLGAKFHKDRREALRKLLPENSVAAFFANPVRNRANDVEYVYHQDPNFYYLTGYREPDAVLLIFKDFQTGPKGEKYNEIIFVQPRNEMYEMWTGRRLGEEGVKKELGFNQVFANTQFADYGIDFSKFKEVLFNPFYNDVRNTRDKADLYDLIADFKTKVGYRDDLSNSLAVEPQAQNINLNSLRGMMGELRGVKTEEELVFLRKAVNISTVGQREVMKAITPGMSEREIQGIHEFVFRKYGAEFEGYPSIVGAGHNGCILHYIDNYKPEVSSKELILMDLGAEYRGYSADVTRTIPVSGKFSKEQKAIYDLVYKAQEEAMKLVKPGVSMSTLNAKTVEIINEGLFELGIISSKTERHNYYPHGCCHHIGLDVHDPGNRTLVKNMAFTIEPGIYIPEGSKCDKKWWGIAVRIEDDVLVTDKGWELLSKLAPRSSEEIELLMAEPSPLDQFTLPDIDKH